MNTVELNKQAFEHAAEKTIACDFVRYKTEEIYKETKVKHF